MKPSGPRLLFFGKFNLFLFLPGSVLEDWIFLRICPFLSSYPFYSHIVVHNSPLGFPSKSKWRKSLWVFLHWTGEDECTSFSCETWTHLLLQELQNCDLLPNSHQQKDVGFHQKKKKKRYPHPRAKEKPQQDSMRDTIMFAIKPHTFQRHLEGPNKPVWTRTQRPHRDWARTVFKHLL